MIKVDEKPGVDKEGLDGRGVHDFLHYFPSFLATPQWLPCFFLRCIATVALCDNFQEAHRLLPHHGAYFLSLDFHYGVVNSTASTRLLVRYLQLAEQIFDRRFLSATSRRGAS
jgi:hypothetical protein